MAVLNNSDHFLHELTSHFIQDTFEESLVVVQLECQLELELETLPNMVIFAHLGTRIAQHLLLEEIVEVIGVFPVLAQGVHFDKSFFAAALFRDVEFVRTLRVVDAVLVRQLNQHVHGGTRGQVSMMHCWLWHHLKALVKVRVHQLRQHLIVLIGEQ